MVRRRAILQNELAREFAARTRFGSVIERLSGNPWGIRQYRAPAQSYEPRLLNYIVGIRLSLTGIPP